MNSAVPTPDVPHPQPSTHSERVRTVALVTLAVLAVTAALYIGRDVFIPLGLALVFTALLRPVVRWLERAHVSTALGASLVVILALVLLGSAAMAAANPVQQWVKQAPE